MIARTLRTLFAALPALLLVAGCGGAASMPAEPMAQAGPVAAAPPPVLERSYFSKDMTGSLTEDDLQRVLESPIDLELPARVGVVPLTQPFDPKGSPPIGLRSTASRDFAKALAGNPHFSQVSDISTDLPNAGGIEGLRAIAARYRLRYLVLYSERFEDATHVNGWAWLYPTVLGMFIAPGVTVESQGIVQADFLDVRTGTVLFSVLEPMHVKETERMIGAARAHKEHQAKAASEAARTLAKRVHGQTNALVAFADSGDHRPGTRIVPAPVLASSRSSSAPAAAGQHAAPARP